MMLSFLVIFLLSRCTVALNNVPVQSKVPQLAAPQMSQQFPRLYTRDKFSSMTGALSLSVSSGDGDYEDSSRGRGPKQPLKQLLMNRSRLIVDRTVQLGRIKNFALQWLCMIALYLFHLGVLSQRAIVFPFQLLPSADGHFTGVGWDSVAGILTLVGYRKLRKRLIRSCPSSSIAEQEGLIPAIFSTPTVDALPWKLPTVPLDNTNTGTDSRANGSNKSALLTVARQRGTTILAVLLLVQAYLWTGRFSVFWEDILYEMSAAGWPLTAPMHRSLVVLFGHLSWVAAGSCILGAIPRPPPFFRRDHAATIQTTATDTRTTKTSHGSDDATSSNEMKERSRNTKNNLHWFNFQCRKINWLWWVAGGYYISTWLFNIADLLNVLLLPKGIMEAAPESVVSQLVNPEHNDWLASAVGYIAPCVTAPVWEEVLYRGFLLPALQPIVGFWGAVFIQGIVFSAHHMSATAAIPLTVLGWLWAILYVKSGNLWTPIAIHALWNSRIFLSSWLGL